VDYSNLQRQILHTDADVGRPKAVSAKETIAGINPNVEVVIHNTAINSGNAFDLIRPYDIVVDGTDNFPTRYLTNDACVLLKKPNVYGSIFRFEGQASVFAPHLGGPCYRCLYPEPPPPGMVPSCAEGGVLGVLPGIIGCIQTTEILKLALGKGTSMVGRLLLFNALDMKFRELKLRRDPACPICGDNPTIKELIDYDPCLLQTDITANYANYANRKRTNDRRFPLADFLSRSSRFSLSGLAYACNATAA
jgi:adenylyltransferase/sulfurtransferase